MKIITGGAIGSDNVFATKALNRGIDVDIHSFKDHTWQIPNSNRKHAAIITHTDEELNDAIPYLKEANKTLKRQIPPAGYIRNLLCRNYYQINNTECVIAIGRLDSATNTVKGGTGWAVQMALDKRLPVFLFDMISNLWLASFSRARIISVWHRPILKEYDLITGIGSRELTPKGAQEIKNLFEV